MSAIIPLPVSVGDGISISGTVTVNVANTPNVVVANSSPINVNVANTPSVSVSGTVSVSVANTPNVVVANSSPINVNVANTPNVNVANTVSVSAAPQQFSLKIITGTTSATSGALTPLTTTSTLAHAFIVVSGSSSGYAVDVYATKNNKAFLGYAIGNAGANATVVYYNFGDNVVDLSTIYITGDGSAVSVPYTVIYW